MARLHVTGLFVTGLLAAGILGALAPAEAQVTTPPALLNFQGRLLKPDGTALPDGNYSLTVSLWDAPTGGNQRWSQALASVPVSRGVFSVALSAGTSGLFNGNLWLETQVGTDPAMSPRVQVASVAYAMKAGTVPDGSIDNRSLATDAASLEKVSGGDMVNVGGNIGIGLGVPQARLTVLGGVANVGVFAGDLAPFGAAPFETNMSNAGSTHAWFAENQNRVASIIGGNGFFRNTLGVGGDAFGNITSFVQTQPNWYSLFNTDGVRTLVAYHGPVGATDGVWFGTSTNHPLILQTNNTGQFIFTPDGRLGIGTMNPAQALEVAGTAQVKLLRIAGGSDVAEPFNVSDGAPEPGMVVAIDPGRTGELRLADSAYDPTVAGIISGANGVNAGMTLSQPGTEADGKHPVALTGRVWCYADADANGKIAPGDLLTTSNTPGHAMKATDPVRRQGAILGKAMSRLDSGKGLVLVLVTLQ